MMGRKKKYNTDEERLEAKRARWTKWYEKNKEKLNAHRMEKYYEKKLQTFGCNEEENTRSKS
jgi:hypothetical protein